MPPSSFDISACIAALGAEAGTFHLDARAECDSTNTQLMLMAEAGAPSGTVVVTERQTAGRGRRGHTWVSTPHDSLTFSLLWRFSASSSAPQALSLAVGLGLQHAMASAGVKAALKWPNDILCADKKLAGVLIETQPGDIKSTVIGIGLNLRLPAEMPAEISAQAIALEQAMPDVPPRERLLAALLTHLAVVLRRYEAESFAGLREEWQARHAFQERKVRISGGAHDMEGICGGVTDGGELLLTTAQGIRRVVSGDVSLRPAA